MMTIDVQVTIDPTEMALIVFDCFPSDLYDVGGKPEEKNHGWFLTDGCFSFCWFDFQTNIFFSVVFLLTCATKK